MSRIKHDVMFRRVRQVAVPYQLDVRQLLQCLVEFVGMRDWGRSLSRLFVAAYCAMDLMILVDSSGSVRDNQMVNRTDNWNLTKEFLIDVLETGTRIGRYYDRVALIEFSSQVSFSSECLMRFQCVAHYR